MKTSKKYIHYSTSHYQNECVCEIAREREREGHSLREIIGDSMYSKNSIASFVPINVCWCRYMFFSVFV